MKRLEIEGGFVPVLYMLMTIEQHRENLGLELLLHLTLLDQLAHQVGQERGEVGGAGVEHQATLLKALAQLHQGVEGERSDMRRPPVSPLCFQVFLILDPPGQRWEQFFIDQCANLAVSTHASPRNSSISTNSCVHHMTIS